MMYCMTLSSQTRVSSSDLTCLQLLGSEAHSLERHACLWVVALVGVDEQRQPPVALPTGQRPLVHTQWLPMRTTTAQQ